LSDKRIVAIVRPTLGDKSDKVSCYDCKWGTWQEENKMNYCTHADAAHAVACYCYNRQCPYYEEGE